ncbi:MAG: AAA family ATPase [Elsteraceae bacterium]
MKFSITNVTGVLEATFALAAPITLVAGENAAGKSSVLRAIGRTLCGQPLPPGVLKKESALMLRSGSKTGSVVITTEDGEIRADYPAADFTLVTGAAPKIGRMAAGLIDFSGLSTDERALALLAAMKAETTQEDVERELTKVGIDEKKIKSVIDFLGFEKGRRDIAWESTVETYKKQATQAKGAWKTHAGQNWGASIAVGWRPEGFTEDLKDIARKDLQQAIIDATAARDKAIAANGVDDETAKKLQALIDSTPDLDAKVEAAEKAVQDADLRVQTAQAHRNALPTASDSGNATCPCCDAKLRIHRLDLGGTEFQISKVEPIPAKERDERLSNIAKADGDLANAKDGVLNAKRVLTEAKAELQAAYDADDRLKAMKKAKEEAGLSSSPLSVESATEAVAAAETRLKLADAYRNASTAQAEIEVNLKIADVLGPDGVRKQKLLAHLDMLNRQILRPITQAGDLPDVSVTEEMDIQVNGRPFQFLSGSERWLADTVIRLAVAKLQQAPVVIIDAADILDLGRKNGLFTAIEENGVPCILGMTIAAGIQKCWDFSAPDVALGETYWVAGGVLKPLAQARPMKAAA